MFTTINAICARTVTWTIDPERSRIRFAIRHLMLATVRGGLRGFEGTLRIDGAGDMHALGAVRAATLETGDPVRDRRLLGKESFDVVAVGVEEVAAEVVRVIDLAHARGAPLSVVQTRRANAGREPRARGI